MTPIEKFAAAIADALAAGANADQVRAAILAAAGVSS